MKRFALPLIVVAALLCAFAVAEAIEPYLEFKGELDLSEQQVAKLESSFSSLRKAEVKAEADLRIAEIELEELLRAEKVDLPKVKSKLEEISKLQAGLKFLHIKAEQDAKSVLTDEQLKRFRSLRDLKWMDRERMEIEEGLRERRELMMREKELRERELKEMKGKQKEMLEDWKRMMMKQAERRDRELMQLLEDMRSKMANDVEGFKQQLRREMTEELEKFKQQLNR